MYKLRLKAIFLLLALGLLSPYQAVSEVVSTSTYSQQSGSLSGAVVSSGQPVVGATVIVEGTSKGAITDQDGKFFISDLKTGDVVEVSFMGYVTQSIPYGGEAIITVELVADAQQMDEVVVVGYGTMRKSDVTGSIATAKGEEISKAQSYSALDNLRGKVSGVNIFSNSGQPGSTMGRVIIRGIGTINSSSDPLYVVDGVAMENFDQMNPNDIESIEVLKDASSAAIYGARGANGVILVTTKRGNKDGSLTVNYQGSVSISQMASKMDVLSSSEWCDAFMQSLENENKYYGYNWDTSDRSYWFNDPTLFDSEGNPLYDTDWQDEATRTAVSHNHQISIQKGDEKSSVGAFLNYTDQQGVILNTYQKRISAKLTYDAKPKKWLTTNTNLSVNHNWGNSTSETSGSMGLARLMVEFMPFLPVTMDGEYTNSNNLGNLSNIGGFVSCSNPVQVAEEQTNMTYRTQIFGNAGFTFHLAKGLDLKTQLGIDQNSYENKYYSGVELLDLSYPNGAASFTNSNTTYWQEETYLNYDNQWGKHRLNAMAGLSFQEQVYNYNYSYTSGFSDDFFQYNNMGAGTNPSSPSSSYSRWAMNSFFLRGAYSYNNKYMATVTARVDGSSKFGANNKYAFFPSLGLGWNISEENFMKSASNVDLLKLHTSYGITGNSEIGTYSSLANVTTSTLLMNDGYSSSSYISSLANPDLKWEKTAQFDIGVNLMMFNNRINLDASYYYKLTTDLLLSTPVPHSSGFSSVMDNVGSVSNKGFDFMVNTTNIRTHDFEWTSTFSLNYNVNKVESLGTNDEDIEPGPWFVSGSNTILRVGESLGSFYGYVRYGVWTEDEAAEAAAAGSAVGRPKRSEEKEVLGDGLPDFTGSFINNFRYKNFDFTLDFQFVWGVEILQQYYHSANDRFGYYNALSSVYYGAYDGTNPETMQQAIFSSNTGHAGQDTEVDSSWVCNGAYLRANLIQLGYNVSGRTLDKWGIRNLRVYAGVNNAFVITAKDFQGYDPEMSSSTSQWGQNVMFYGYPKARTYTMGVNLTF